jgi:CheY-like chemotaxis protein
MVTESVHDASTVFVVDDGDDYRFLVQQVFTRYLPQYKVSLFSGGDELLAYLQTNPTRPALILLDLHMPGMSGLETLAQLKKDQHGNGQEPAVPPLRSVPVVMVTSSTSAEEIRMCYEAGANSCLAKPFGLETMRQHLTLICQYWMDTNRPVMA